MLTHMVGLNPLGSRSEDEACLSQTVTPIIKDNLQLLDLLEARAQLGEEAPPLSLL